MFTNILNIGQYIEMHISQARSHDCQNEEVDRSSAPSPPLPYLLLEVGPLKSS